MLSIIKNDLGKVKAEEKPVSRPKARKPFKLRKRLHENDNTDARPPIPIDESELSLCVLVWQSTVVQALYDLANDSPAPEARILRADAASWFSSANKDLELVCDLACLSKSRVQRMAKKVMKEGGKSLEGFNFRTIRKDYSDRAPTRRNKNRGQ